VTASSTRKSPSRNTATAAARCSPAVDFAVEKSVVEDAGRTLVTYHFDSHGCAVGAFGRVDAAKAAFA